MKTFNYIISTTSNCAEARCFCISAKTLKCQNQITQESQLDESQYDDNWNITLPTVKAVNRLLVLPGVLKVNIRRNVIAVVRPESSVVAEVFSWDDIQPEIINILKEIYFADTDVTIVDKTGTRPPECINRILYKNTKSPTVRWYGVSTKLLNCTDTVTQRQTLDESKYTDNWNATFPTVKAVNRLLVLPGVLELIIRPYEINVSIAAVYNWDDLHKSIITILQQVYFADVWVDIAEAGQE